MFQRSFQLFLITLFFQKAVVGNNAMCYLPIEFHSRNILHQVILSIFNCSLRIWVVKYIYPPLSSWTRFDGHILFETTSRIDTICKQGMCKIKRHRCVHLSLWPLQVGWVYMSEVNWRNLFTWSGLKARQNLTCK